MSKTKEIIPINQPFDATIKIPGCLSYTTRALIIAAMSKDEVELKNPLKSDDVYSMLSCLKEIGIKITEKEDSFIVHNCIQELNFQNLTEKEFLNKKVNFICNGGISGRTIRSILPLLCLVPGVKVLTADKEFLKRPIQDQVESLIQLGAEIEYLEKKGSLPVLIKTSKLNKNYAKMKGNISSQYFAGIMMIAPLFNGVELDVEGKQVSKSYIDITIDIMKTFGVKVENQNYQKYIVKPNQDYKLSSRYTNKENKEIAFYQIEGDYSSASYFAAMAALTASKIELTNLNPDSVQGDKTVMQILQKMGAKVTFKQNSVTIIGTQDLKPVLVDMENAIDQPPVISVLASFADGISKITGIGILKYKESDRLKAITTELKKMGIKTEISKDSEELTIFGGSPKGAEIETYKDHRIAMAFAVAGLKIKNQKIKDSDVVKKSFPKFWQVLETICQIKEVS